MKFLRRFASPLVVFVGVQIVWVLVVVFWVRWFLGAQRRLLDLAQQYGPDLPKGGVDWFILTEGLVLLAVILAGVYVIFLYWRRQSALYREQKRLVSQVTHELKSPVASLQLHLETIRMRHPAPEKLDAFVGTMLEDTGRLDALINNLLGANRLEQKGFHLALRHGDLSAFVERYFKSRQGALPPGSNLELHVEPGLQARFETESLSMALRNLLENAERYSDGPPQVAVHLTGEGDRCHLTFADRGRGIEPRDQRKVFRMFYRVLRADEKAVGSGLGLFIVKAVVLRHKGKVWLESEGSGKGTTFHILLPRLPGKAERKQV